MTSNSGQSVGGSYPINERFHVSPGANWCLRQTDAWGALFSKLSGWAGGCGETVLRICKAQCQGAGQTGGRSTRCGGKVSASLRDRLNLTGTSSKNLGVKIWHWERAQIGICIVSRRNPTREVQMGACGYLTFSSSLTFFLITHGICTSVAQLVFTKIPYGILTGVMLNL